MRSAHVIFWLIGFTLFALMLIAALSRLDARFPVVGLGVAAMMWLAWVVINLALASLRASRSDRASALSGKTATMSQFVDTEAAVWQVP